MAAPKSIEERIRELSKAINEKVPDAALVSQLEQLHDFSATEQILRTTRAGVIVNGLRTRKTKEATEDNIESAREVAALAAKLVNKWKQDVKKNASGVKATNGKLGTSSPVSRAASGTPKLESSATETYQGNPEKRNAKVDGVSTKFTDDERRNKSIEFMYNGLAFMSTEPIDTILSCARNIEKTAYDHFSADTGTDYTQRIRMLFLNLKNKDNGPLRQDVTTGTISAERLMTMTHEDLASDKLRDQTRQLKKEVMDEAMVPPETRPISTMFRCAKCQAKETYHVQAQTRSADEPMTNFLECVACGNKWKFS